MELHIQETVACNILKEIHATFQPLVEKKGLTISVEVGQCTPKECTVLADEDKIRQVQINFAGGRIWVESQLGVGSTFYFEIPYNRKSKQVVPLFEEGQTSEEINDPQSDNIKVNTILDESNEQIELTNNKQTRVLLVEDTEDNQLLFLAFLKNEHLQVNIAENGLEAVEKFKKASSDPSQQPYSLILMDMQMPVMDGYQATREIRSWEKVNSSKSTSIYALTAYALKEERQKSLDAGCDEHLIKPIKKQQLLDVIRKYTQ